MYGLRVSVYRASGRGERVLSAHYDRFTLTGASLPLVFEPNAGAPELRMDMRHGLLVAVPPQDEWPVDKQPSFGGNFVWTNDARLPADYPIPIHDRFE